MNDFKAKNRKNNANGLYNNSSNEVSSCDAQGGDHVCSKLCINIPEDSVVDALLMRCGQSEDINVMLGNCLCKLALSTCCLANIFYSPYSLSSNLSLYETPPPSHSCCKQPMSCLCLICGTRSCVPCCTVIATLSIPSTENPNYLSTTYSLAMEEGIFEGGKLRGFNP